MSDQQEYIVLAAIGADKPGIVNDLSKTVTEHQGNILDSRMLAIGGEFSLVMMINGPTQQLDTITHALKACCADLGLDALCRKTHKKGPIKGSLPYIITVVALDHPGIVHEVTGFFAHREINIEDLKTETYAAPLTGSPMFSLQVMVNIPIRHGLAELKEQFFDFCDGLNLDASLEPVR